MPSVQTQKDVVQTSNSCPSGTEYSSFLWVHFSVDREEKYDPGNVTTNDILIDLIKGMGRNACRISFFIVPQVEITPQPPFHFLRHVTDEVTTRWLKFCFVSSIFGTQLQQGGDL